MSREIENSLCTKQCHINFIKNVWSFNFMGYFKQMGVEIKLNSIVTNVTKEGVYIGDQFIEMENII